MAGVDDARRHGVLEVVADVGDAIGPRHHLALGGRGRGPGPRVVADAVQRLGAQVERRQDHVGAPHRVVVPLGHVGAQRVLAGVPARAVAAVVAEGDGLGERDVEPERGGDAAGHLGHLEGVGEAGALVVVREDEDLGLAGQPAEGGGVEDAVPIALEAGAPRVRLLLPLRGAPAPRARVALRGEAGVLGLPPAPRGRCPARGPDRRASRGGRA